MNERDRVLDAFRNCITEPKCKDCPWTECSTLDNGSVEIPRDLALAVMRELVAQEPRVMTIEMRMTVGEFFGKFCEGFEPEVVEGIPMKWLREKIKEHTNEEGWQDYLANSFGLCIEEWQKEQEAQD